MYTGTGTKASSIGSHVKTVGTSTLEKQEDKCEYHRTPTCSREEGQEQCQHCPQGDNGTHHQWEGCTPSGQGTKIEAKEDQGKPAHQTRKDLLP